MWKAKDWSIENKKASVSSTPQQMQFCVSYGPYWSVGALSGWLERVQRKALRLCLGLPSTAGSEVMEMASGTIPLDLRFAEIAIRDIGKIAAKRNDEPVKKLLNDCLESETDHGRHVTALGKAISQAEEMKRETGTIVLIFQPEPEYEKGHLMMAVATLAYWSTLGSSKSRSKEQEQFGRQVVEKLARDTVLAFTDGSCLSNPGPCGAGAAIFPPDMDWVELRRPVAVYGSILLAEAGGHSFCIGICP